MSTILLQPDALNEGLVNLCGSMKPFIIGSDQEVEFLLQQGETVILDEVYMPVTASLTGLDIYGGVEWEGSGSGEGGLVSFVEIDVSKVIDRLLSIEVPLDSVLVTEQTTGYGDFTAMIDGGTPIVFRVIKGGVGELNLLEATPWMEYHWLTWQPQTKYILQEAPEWLGIYPIEAGEVMVTAWFTDGTSQTGVLVSLQAGILYSVNTSWSEIGEHFLGSDPVLTALFAAWDIWYEVGSVQKTPVQRYQLRNRTDEEHLYVWVNTVGGVDSYSFTGYLEEDEKLEHKNAIYYNDTISEYDLTKPREYHQATGYLDQEESYWMKDFFYSRRKYRVRDDGSFGPRYALKPVAVISSKVISSTQDDEFNYEFTYRLGIDEQLLNGDQTTGPLPAPEGLSAFFLTDLLSSLSEASYHDALILAVQSPYAIGWQKISLAELWGGALTTLIDGVTIRIINGKLVATGTTISTGAGDIEIINLIKSYLDYLNISYNDSGTELISGAVLWESGLTYRSTDIVYKIQGVRYTAIARSITLEAADPNLARTDVFYVDQYSNLMVLTGTPAQNPTEPELPSNVVKVMSVLINARSLTPANVTVEKVYDEHTSAEWITTEVHDTYISVDFDCLVTPFAGTKRIQLGIESPTGKNEHRVGDTYRGGVIFYIESATSGYIAAEEDTALNVFWSNISGYPVYTTGATGVEIGTGRTNSDLMLLTDAAKNNAIKYANDLIIEGYDDWYIPSEKELYAMWVNRFLIGNFATKTYWSSTERSWNMGCCISFTDGTAYTRLKNNNYCVRAIRYYNDLTDPADPSIDGYFTAAATSIGFTAPEPVPVRDGIISLWIKSTLPWLTSSMIKIESYFEGVLTGSVAMNVITNMFNYRPGDDTWKQIAVQMYMLAPNKNTLDCIRLSFSGSWPNHFDLGFDDIRYQHGELNLTQKKQEIKWQTDYNFVEPQDGERMLFTTMYPYVLGSTRINVNGVRQIMGDYQHYMEWGDKIYFFYPPEETSAFVIDYDTLVDIVENPYVEDEDEGSGDEGSGDEESGDEGSGSGSGDEGSGSGDEEPEEEELIGTYYISPDGNNSNDGSSAYPFLTIQRAANIANPGDVIIVRDGIYSNTIPNYGEETAIVRLTRSGEAGNPIVFKSEHKWGAVLDGLDFATEHGWMLNGASHIRIEDFEIRDISIWGFIVFTGSDNLEIIGNHIHHIGNICTTTTNGLSAIVLNGVSNIMISENEIHDIGRLSPADGCSSGMYYQYNDHGIYVDNVFNLDIINNIIYNVHHGWPVHFYSGVGLSSGNIAVLHNTLAFGGYWARGLIVLYQTISNLEIINNIFYHNDDGDMEIDPATNPAVAINVGYAYTDVLIGNNIVYQGSGLIVSEPVSGVTITGNLEQTDPLLVDAPNFDFELTGTSPAIGAGTAIGVATDFEGTTRGAIPDIGAYEY